MDASAESIAKRQAGVHAKRLQSAARREYRRAILFRRLQTWPNFAFAGAGPIVTLLRPESQAILGAAAGGWLFLSRTIIAPHVTRQIQRGARILEEFDCHVLGLAWNHALAEPVAHEEVVEAAERSRYTGDWYPDVKASARARAVLICQRSNVIWSRRQHALYATIISVLAATWFALGIAVAVVRDTSLDAYLLNVGLPSLPALIDAIETRNANATTAARRLNLEIALDKAIAKVTETPPGEDFLRSIQDQVFDFRKTSPLIPELLYKWLRPRFNAGMHAAAEIQAQKA